MNPPAAVTVTRTVSIARPHELVADQFADVAHHAATGVHRGVRFVPIDDDGRTSTYEQLTRQGPVTLRQRFVLDATDRSHQVHTVVSGAFTGGTLTFDVRPESDTTTEVTATLRAPRKGLTRIVAPLLPVVLGRALAAALEEDREDLESGSYAGAGGGTTREPGDGED